MTRLCFACYFKVQAALVSNRDFVRATGLPEYGVVRCHPVFDELFNAPAQAFLFNDACHQDLVRKLFSQQRRGDYHGCERSLWVNSTSAGEFALVAWTRVSL